MYVSISQSIKTFAEHVIIGWFSGPLKIFLEIYANADPQPNNKNCFEDAKYDIFVEILFQNKLLSSPKTLFRGPRDCVVIKEFWCVTSLVRNRNSIVVSYPLFDSSDMDCTFDGLYNLRNPIQISSKMPEPVITSSKNTGDNISEAERIIAPRITKRFTRDERFTYKLGEYNN